MTETIRRRGRPATGLQSCVVRVPLALRPAVEELVATYKRLKWMPACTLASVPAGCDEELSRRAGAALAGTKRAELLAMLRTRQAATVERLAEELAEAERELADTELKIIGL